MDIRHPSRTTWPFTSRAPRRATACALPADEGNLIMDGITALAMAGRRAIMGEQIRLDGPGIAAMRAVLEDYAALLEVLPARTVIDCHRKTERRIREILAGKAKDHDIEIIHAGAMA